MASRDRSTRMTMIRRSRRKNQVSPRRRRDAENIKEKTYHGLTPVRLIEKASSPRRRRDTEKIKEKTYHGLTPMRFIEKSEFTAKTQRHGEDQGKNLPRINTDEAHRKSEFTAKAQRRREDRASTSQKNAPPFRGCAFLFRLRVSRRSG
jgi:hypothetical protein